ncbi:conserved protein of unknown function [Xenorhabdus poinarii G6]|uniref:TonB C-terminal domain-containing protein n=1 Tax=Xenorhabdus poinarii G6 TaxID=1354304 RepID=A0A068R7Z5_9GAMM|nr:energy transducer TonB [Xenorhabdus poinarii]CDG23328.1 conserved protein of unknown function [Xenorhabdus poinarii G6]
MTNTAILDNPIADFPLVIRKRFLIGILIAILVHINLIWLLNRPVSYDDSAHHINNPSSTTGLSITLIAALSSENKPEPVSSPSPRLTAPESPTTPQIVLDKAVHPQNRMAKPQEFHETKKRQDRQQEKSQERMEKNPTQPSPEQKDHQQEQETHGSDQINSAGSMSRAATSQPLVGQGNSETDNYRARLRQEIERHKRYPRKAKRMKQQGTVTINFTLSDDGTLTAAKVVNSSGNDALDNAALDAVERANSVGAKPTDIPPDVTLQLDFKLD